MTDLRVQTSCNKNRAEEFGPDVWDYFVIPPFFDQLDIQTATKPRIIEGGRGSGKTMLLRYFSYQSTFSSRRTDFTDDSLAFIGLYWKADTQFARQLFGKNQTDDEWSAAFHHYLALVISAEILNAVRAISASKHEALSGDSLASLDFSLLSGFDPEIPSSEKELHRYFITANRRFETWLNNPKKVPQPIFLPGRSFALAVINDLKNQLPCLKASNFSFYLDEYENLTPLQRKIINTNIKHCEPPLLFHVAMKKGSLADKSTVGDEYINDISDYRRRDMDDLLHSSKSDFELFAAEILFSRFALAQRPELPISLPDLRDPRRLKNRLEPEYAKRVLAAARKLLPGKTDKEHAALIWEDPTLKKIVQKSIDEGLGDSEFKSTQFTSKLPAEVILVVACLVHRALLQKTEILDEIAKFKKNEENRFTGPTSWLHNNLLGAVLKVYSSSSRPCLVHSGFDTFVLLARGNLRHFLELCDRCLSGATDEQLENGLPLEVQADAARQASSYLLSDIRNFGNQGHALRNLVLSIGSLFSLSQRRASQSEPEVNHFNIKRGSSSLSDEDNEILREAIKWCVLFEERETKEKAEDFVIESDWILNPIYAPYFKISHRKIRKLPLSLEDFRILVRGEIGQRNALIKQYRKEWDLEGSQESTQSLLAYLFE